MNADAIRTEAIERVAAHMPSDIQFCDVHNTHEWHCMAGDGTKVDRLAYAAHIVDALGDLLPTNRLETSSARGVRVYRYVTAWRNA